MEEGPGLVQATCLPIVSLEGGGALEIMLTLMGKQEANLTGLRDRTPRDPGHQKVPIVTAVVHQMEVTSLSLTMV